MNKVPKVTLDNNCVINLFDKESNSSTSVTELEELVTMAFSGKIEISITTRVEADLENDRDDTRRNALMQHLKLIPLVGTTFRLDVSHLDSKDMLSGESSVRLHDDIQKIIFPGGIDKTSKSYINRINDIDHLVGHILDKRDIFITDDKGILKKQESLKKSPGIIVMSPAECLEYINTLEKQKEKKVFNEPNYEIYHNPALKGVVSFDYSNNDGNFIIGQGYYLFETYWSSSSQDSIHAYRSGNVDSISLVKDLDEINKIVDGSLYDNSSRVRTPEEGQIIILKNKNNIYAALKIIDVKYDGRDDEKDELTFEYFIQTNGTASFLEPESVQIIQKKIFEKRRAEYPNPKNSNK